MSEKSDPFKALVAGAASPGEYRIIQLLALMRAQLNEIKGAVTKPVGPGEMTIAKNSLLRAPMESDLNPPLRPRINHLEDQLEALQQYNVDLRNDLNQLRDEQRRDVEWLKDELAMLKDPPTDE